MSEHKLQFILPGVPASTSDSRVQSPATRGAAGPANDLLAGIEVKRHFNLSPSSRAAGQKTTLEAAEDDVLALELEGDFVFYTSAGQLAADLRRRAPGDGPLRLDALHSPGPASRGINDWFVRALSVLGIDSDAIVDAAVDKAKEWLGDQARDLIEKGVTWAGTKALMWAIEDCSRRQPFGLYPWAGDDGVPTDLEHASVADFNGWRQDEPVLVFIHGTGSSTPGSFGALRESGASREWDALQGKFGQHIYAFEHRTFAESPIENAYALAEALPPGARLNLVTHSRGGLVGDLLCVAGLGDGLVDEFARGDTKLAAADEADRTKLLALNGLLAERQFRIERYARIACPAQGTLLASSHLDAFLSVLLHLIGLVPYLQGPAYAATKRMVLQIVKNRTDPRLVPGIEAMLPESPLTALLGQATPKDNAEIAVIAGDIEGGSLLKRIGAFLTDHVFFEEEDNDLVVDTDSMYGGVARDCGRYLFDQGSDVSHFRYFANTRTRRALQSWITDENPADLRDFLPLKPTPKPPARRRGNNGGPSDQPVVILVPDLMGSHLKIGDTDRAWFDFQAIARGALQKLRYGAHDLLPDKLLGSYDDLSDYLGESHVVHGLAYDWRRPLEDAALQLSEAVSLELKNTARPVRILSHGTGGLVVRMMIALHRGVWDALMQRNDARWVTLGTPNRGSHVMVDMLLGLTDTVRQLARLAVTNDSQRPLQWVVDLLAGFPGVLQSLPRPDFTDTGGIKLDYYTPKTWNDLASANGLLFGELLGERAADALTAAKAAWGRLDEQLPDVDRIAYVAGYGHRTPCGIEVEKVGDSRRLRMIGTFDGDGAVTHDSGLLGGLQQNKRVWFMNTDHVGLTGNAELFPALLDLLEHGDTARMPKEKPKMRGDEPTFRYDAGPVLYPTEESLARNVLGGRKATRRSGRAKYVLSVSCRAMDLRHARDPILVGHYQGDPISGPEAQIDRHLVDRALTLRSHLGLYAGALGTATIVLIKATEEQVKAQRQPGAVVVGLGEYGTLTAGNLSEAVRVGVLRYLLQLVDRQGGRLPDAAEPQEVGLATLLLGYNSTTNITVDDSVQAVVRGVLVANREFAEGMERQLRVARLEFIELYLDVAISVAYAVRGAAERLARDAQRMGARIEAAPTLESDRGMRQRLEAMSRGGYWPRLIVTNADGSGDSRSPEDSSEGAKGSAAAPQPATPPQHRPELARTLRFLSLSQRARAESTLLQRQPQLLEALIEASVRDPVYNRDLSRTLFKLLVPHDLKETVQQADNMVLVVDGYTANFPWEMLADEEPLVKKTALVRQLATSRFRRQVRSTLDKTAYVVGNPSTEGYYKTFPDLKRPNANALDPLPNAGEEAVAVKELLDAQGYEVVLAPSDSTGLDVINKLFQRPYRIVHISAHGVYQAGEGDSARSGVVLSDGLLITAAEIGQMDIVPDLVFLNCCFLGKTDNSPRTADNRLAYSVARELIEIGVRAVVVNGWAVRDDAAKFFAETFYRSLLPERAAFGKAVFKARLRTYEEFPDCNTWGAFQAYGDPGFVIDPMRPAGGDDDGRKPVAPQELIAQIDELWTDAHHARTNTEKRRLCSKVVQLHKDAPKEWRKLPDVLYSVGRVCAELGMFDEASGYYEEAIAIEDLNGSVPVRAIEQLANLEARHGGKHKDEKLIRRAIDRLLALTRAAGGTGLRTAEKIEPAATAPPEPERDPRTVINPERCALLGSAYKRLAGVLPEWSLEGDEDDPRGAKQALEHSARWYQRAEGIPGENGFSPYNAQNRLGLQAILGTARSPDGELALRAGEIARDRYATSRQYWDLLMAGDGLLIARLIDGSLADATRAAAAEREIIDRYAGLRAQLPESERQLGSVIDQITLFAGFLDRRAQADPRVGPDVAGRLRHIADALEGTAEGRRGGPPGGPGPAPLSPASEASESNGSASASAKPARSRHSPGAARQRPPKSRKPRAKP